MRTIVVLRIATGTILLMRTTTSVFGLLPPSCREYSLASEPLKGILVGVYQRVQACSGDARDSVQR